MENNIHGLLEKLSRGKCSEEEIDYLREYLNSGKQVELDEAMLENWSSTAAISGSEKKQKQIWNKINSQILDSEPREPHRLQRLKPFMKYAAIFVGILLISLLVFRENITEKATPQDAITVEFSDGTLKKLKNDEVVIDQEKGVRIEKDVLTYETGKAESGKLEFHTLNIPKGRKFQLALSDGTYIHLNSGTTLTYPVKFVEGQPRKVFLEGEAFFTVAKDADKFIVSTSGLNTEVLGTEFNVAAHEIANKTEVVLLEGSVRVDYSESKILKPGQKLTFSKRSGNAEIKEVEASEYIAWIDGIIWFENEDLAEIIPKLERHYDVEISLRNDDLGKKKFTGKFRNESIKDVLEVFKMASDLEYEMNQKNIILNQKK